MNDSKLALVAEPRMPSWLHRTLPQGGELARTSALLEKFQLNTVCEEAKCPNRLECYTKKTATFLALGKECTRNCGFCDIAFSKAPSLPDPTEPRRIALSVQELSLKHAVVTMVARDDLPDQGASHMVAIVHAIREINPQTTVELLTSDFSGDLALLDLVLAARPEVFNHNIETVREFSSRVRHKAQYERTLAMLRHAKQSGMTRYVKSGLMVGFGESEEAVRETLRDLAMAGTDIVTMGQYLQPGRNKLRVKEFISPERFAAYAEYGRSLAIPHVYAGPFVRSSYNAHLFVSVT